MNHTAVGAAAETAEIDWNNADYRVCTSLGRVSEGFSLSAAKFIDFFSGQDSLQLHQQFLCRLLDRLHRQSGLHGLGVQSLFLANSLQQ